uniref:Uncharacterized protein n=1 Tax=Tanacetum cinerariifolium TaxID=118510 RepID=A0A6L2LCQ6_TANCI|nr:hypothetical protein [Tanacetum cinerariifolium]
MNLFAFINHSDPTKVRIGKKQIKEGQTLLLESTKGRVVLLAGVNDQGDQNDDVEDAGHDVNEEGATDGQENHVEAGIVRIEDEVPSTIAEKAKVFRKKRKLLEGLVVPSYLPKSKGQIMVPPVPVLVLVENLLLRFRVNWNAVLCLLKLVLQCWLCCCLLLPYVLCAEAWGWLHRFYYWAQSAYSAPAERFVVLSDSPCHSSSNVTDAEVSSIVRYLVLDPPVMTTVIATTVVAAASSVLVPRAGVEPVHASIFADSTFAGTVRGVDYNDFLEFNVGATRQTCLDIEERDVEIMSLRAQLTLKEAKVMETTALEGKAANLESATAIKDIELAINLLIKCLYRRPHVVKILSDKVEELDSNLMGMALHLDEDFYPRAIGRAIEKGMQDGLAASIDHGKARKGLVGVVAYNPSTKANYVSAVNALRAEDFPLLAQPESQKDANIADIMGLLHLEGDDASRRLSLSDAMDPLIEPLSAENLVGEASTSGVPAAFFSTNALSTNFVQASSIPPILASDHEVVDTVPQVEASSSLKIMFEPATY